MCTGVYGRVRACTGVYGREGCEGRAVCGCEVVRGGASSESSSFLLRVSPIPGDGGGGGGLSA